MRPIWFHAASAGDVRAITPLIHALTQAEPAIPHYLSTWTQTGRDMAGRLLPHTPLGRPPLDVPPLPGRALARVRPRLLVLEYLELWPAWARACSHRGVPIVVVDGKVSHRSLRIRALLRRAAGRITHFCAQTPQDAENARSLGVPSARITVNGNGKYDGLIGQPPHVSRELLESVGAVDVVLGSLHPDEERDALTALSQTHYRVLIAPRYPRRVTAIMRRAEALGIDVGLRSEGASERRCVILDSMGELAAAYALGRVAIVGGTFGRRGGQNLIEPAVHGRPVIFGPRHERVLAEANALDGQGGWPASDWTHAVTLTERLLTTPGPDPRAALSTLVGATRRNLRVVLAHL